MSTCVNILGKATFVCGSVLELSRKFSQYSEEPLLLVETVYPRFHTAYINMHGETTHSAKIR